MRARRIVLGLLLCTPFAFAIGPAAGSPDSRADAAFARMASLAGEWKTEDGKESLTYELTAGGTAILEREIAEGRPSMVTLYHRAGDRLMLTHYCMAGNQPRMLARPYDPGNGELVFDFVDATNLSSPASGHMRNVKIRFLDADHIESEWEFHQGGKPSMTVRARYARVR